METNCSSPHKEARNEIKKSLSGVEADTSIMIFNRNIEKSSYNTHKSSCNVSRLNESLGVTGRHDSIETKNVASKTHEPKRYEKEPWATAECS